MRGSSQLIVNSARYKTQNTKRKIIWVSAKAATVPISVLSNPIVWCCAAHGAALSPQRYRPPAAPFDTFHLHNIGMDWTRLLTTRRPGLHIFSWGRAARPGAARTQNIFNNKSYFDWAHVIHGEVQQCSRLASRCPDSRTTIFAIATLAH